MQVSCHQEIHCNISLVIVIVSEARAAGGGISSSLTYCYTHAADGLCESRLVIGSPQMIINTCVPR